MRKLFAVVLPPNYYAHKATNSSVGFQMVKVIDPRDPGGKMITLRKAVDVVGQPIKVDLQRTAAKPDGRLISQRVHTSLARAQEEAMAASYPGRQAVVMNVDTLDFMDDDAQSGQEIAAEALRAVVQKARDERVMTIVRAWFARKAAEEQELNRRCWAAARAHARHAAA